MLHKHPPARRFCLASSGIYVQNLIQFGNFWIRSTTTDKLVVLRLGRGDKRSQQFRVNAALYGPFR
jgi:hypothetical protein